MKDNILNLPSDVLGDIFKEIYSEYEKSIRKMFSAPPCEIEITAQQVAKAFDKRGADRIRSAILHFCHWGVYRDQGQV